MNTQKNEGKKWAGVTVTPAVAEGLKHYLKTQKIDFEPSSCYEFIHIEFLATDAEVVKIFNVLNDLTLAELKNFTKN